MNRIVAGVVLALSVSFPQGALAVADGPDHWRVSGVAADDTLNVRMGPGTDFLVIAELPFDARGLRAVTCTPYVTFQIFETLSEEERAGLPPRWCMVFQESSGIQGWVSGEFLTEDGDFTAGQ